MKIIHEADEKITKLWNEGAIERTKYRLLTYVLLADVEEGTLIHNVVTGELLLLDAEEMQNLSDLPCDYAEWMDRLIKKHFIVPQKADDEKNMLSLRRAWNILYREKEITDYTILPTTACNARCFYCFEAGYKHETMTDETADKLVDFIEAHRGDKKIHISWFGGEPLVGIRQIDRISKALKERNIPFSASMASNGYLFDEALAGRVKEDWNLTNIQITLDGTEKIYNETKAYMNPCESPFKRVLNNIGFLTENEIQVSVRMNLGKHDTDDLEALIHELTERFENKEYLSAYVYLLFDDCGFIPTHFEEEEREQLEETQHRLSELLRELGLGGKKQEKNLLPRLRTSRCMADNDSGVTVAPGGDFSKCEHTPLDEIIGNIEQGITERDTLKKFKETYIGALCNGCSLYPGCIYLKMCRPGKPCTPAGAARKRDYAKREIAIYYQRVKSVENNAPENEEKGGFRNENI